MKKQLFILLMMLSPMMAMAYDAEIDGIYYNFNGTEAMVTSGDNLYTGDVVIPTVVTYNETEYSVVSIRESAFDGCSGLNSITIPNSVTSIGVFAFRYCESLTSVTIPNSVTSIGQDAFIGCSSLISVAIPGSLTNISQGAFYGCSSLTSVTISSGVKSIGAWAFHGCSSLTSIMLPNSVTSIEVGAFSGCYSLTSIVISNSVTTIESNAFTGCSSLSSITIPNSVTNLGEGVFDGCSSLISITIPNSVITIGANPFENCTGLTSIVVEEGNTNYDSRENCNAIIEKSSTTLIVGCNNTIIPNDVTCIGNSAFCGCSGLISIIVPNSVTAIEDRAFAYCSSLISINIPNSVTKIGNNTFRNCSGLTSITLPNSITSIGEGAFCACSGLTSVKIPNTMTNIEFSAFNGCTSLASVIIPNTVTNISKFAFRYCSGLTDIYCYAKSVPTVVYDSFEFSSISNATLHVPCGSVDEYKTTGFWADFKEIVESDKLDVTNLNIKSGESDEQEISLSNSLSNFVAFQMDLTLPDGVDLDKTGCTLSSRITDEDQELTIGKLESGAYRITSTSLSLTPINGNDGTLLSLKLTAEDGCIGGQATLSNIIFSTAESEKVVMSDKTFDISILYNLTYKVDGQEYKDTCVTYGSALKPEAEPTKDGYTFGGWSEIPETMPNHDVDITGRFYLFGDVNTDEDVDVVDVVDIARFVVATPSANFREKLADLNFDNMVNIADAVTLVNFIAGDQNFARAMESYGYDQCQLQLVSVQDNSLSFCLNGDADFTAFQFEVELPENTDITAMRINGLRKDGHQLLYNKVAENRYRVAVLSLSNAVFKGNEGELLNISIDGQPTEEICMHDILFVTKSSTSISFDDISLSDTATGIAHINENESKTVIYDLQGRRLAKLQRGVNIINGNKVVIK